MTQLAAATAVASRSTHTHGRSNRVSSFPAVIVRTSSPSLALAPPAVVKVASHDSCGT